MRIVANNFPVKVSLSIKQNYIAWQWRQQQQRRPTSREGHYRTNFRFGYFNQLLNVIIFTPSYFNIARAPAYAAPDTLSLQLPSDEK